MNTEERKSFAERIGKKQLIAIAAVAFIVNAIAHDGRVTWFEGVLLLAVYAMLALAFFFATP